MLATARKLNGRPVLPGAAVLSGPRRPRLCGAARQYRRVQRPTRPWEAVSVGAERIKLEMAARIALWGRSGMRMLR